MFVYKEISLQGKTFQLKDISKIQSCFIFSSPPIFDRLNHNVIARFLTNTGLKNRTQNRTNLKSEVFIINFLGSTRR